MSQTPGSCKESTSALPPVCRPPDLLRHRPFPVGMQMQSTCACVRGRCTVARPFAFPLARRYPYAPMFGNRLGWSISAVIVILTAVVLVMLSRYGQPSSPGELGRNAASFTITMPVDPAGIARSMTESFDPAPIYQEAIAAYEGDPELFDAHDRIKTTEDPRVEKLRPVMDLLVKAAQSRQHNVFGANPEEIINYDPDRPRVNAIRKIGKTAIYLGLLHNREKRPDEARRLYDAVYALGAKLYHERLIWE